MQTSPHWVKHYLASKGWDLSEEPWEARLRDSRTALLLDGLDEAANDPRRAAMAKMFAQAAIDYPQCRIAVAMRLAAYREESVCRRGGETVRSMISTTRMWTSSWVVVAVPARRQHGRGGSAPYGVARGAGLEAGDPRMARDPVMLTALAVVHWNDKRLPDQRAELYESVFGVGWRRERQGRGVRGKLSTAAGEAGWG
ncbi:MAG: hypothetical protein R2762_11460 [Bryobacteraceae bacterium]